MEIKRKNTELPVFTREYLRPTNPSFFIEWDKESNQFRIRKNEKHEK